MIRRILPACLVVIGLAALLWAGAWPAAARDAAQDDAALIIVVELDGALTPAMNDYLQRGIALAEQRQADALVVQLDTPGGSIDLMTRMVEAIRASQVPVIVYIAPRGAMAGSAGTLITLAGHAAVMAPETTIGAASPVGGSGEDLGETMNAKAQNILKASVRALAERRGPEAVRLAEQTIEDAAAVSAQEALDIGLVDFIALDLADLMRQTDGFTVYLNDSPHILRTAAGRVERVDQSLLEILLSILANPSIVFLLLIVGVNAILIELSSPGGWVAGFLGVVCLALGAYGLGVLSVNWFGLVFMILAFILFILEFTTPTHGGLTVAGVVSLIVAGMVLFNSPGAPSFQRVPVALIVIASSLVGLIFFGMLLLALRTVRGPARMGTATLLGQVGEARSALAPRGQVHLGSESWSAEIAPDSPHIPSGAAVEVVAVQGLRLIVRPAQTPPVPPSDTNES